MAQNYKPRPKDWWTERRFELYRLFSEKKTVSSIKELVDGSGKRIFTNNNEIYDVKKAYDNHDDPFVEPMPPADTGGDGGKLKATPPLRAGPTFIATVRPRTVELDPRLFVLYDLTKVVFPEYKKDEGEWIWDAIVTFYDDYAEKFEIGRLFAPIEEGKDDNREIAELAGTIRAEGEGKS